MMNKLFKSLLLALAAVFFASCIEYNMSYPRVVAEFTKFEVEGAKSVTIDPSSLTVSIELDETADIDSVKVISAELAENVSYKNDPVPQILDLTAPHTVVLRMYQDYRWTISATQSVERYIKCANQVGSAVFLEDSNEAFIYVSKSQRLKFLEVSDIKLELLGSSVVATRGKVIVGNNVVSKLEPCSFPMTLDFTNTREFNVVFKGDTTTWKVTAVPVEVPAQISGIAPWCWSADIYATFDGVSQAPAFKYRKAGDEEWIQLPDSLVNVDGVNASARIDSLDQATEYEVKLIFNGEELPGQSFVTETPEQLPNFSFDDWWLGGKVWWPYGEDYPEENRVWDTANPGTGSMIGMNLTTPEEVDVIMGKALRMQSKYVLVKFAAGNLFTGKFVGLVGTTGADLDWGTPFTTKPKALKGYFKYDPAMVNYIENTPVANPSEPDQCQIQVILIDTEKPFKVLPMGGINGPTYDGEMVDISSSDYIMARGVQNYGSTEGKWVEFEIPIEYKDPTRKPTYVILTCASSYLGDYFTGGDGSVMLVDEFEFIYE